MKRMKLLRRVIRNTHSDSLLVALLVFILAVAWVLLLVEPQMHTYGDALWYCFSVITTIGFGDITAVTLVGRVLSIILGLFGILIIGIVVGVVVAYYNEYLRQRRDESLEVFADRLEHLPDLSPDELVDISKGVRTWREDGGRRR